MERVTNPFDEVIKKADEIVDAEYEVEDLDKPTKGGGDEDDDNEDDEDEEGGEDEEEDDDGLSELAAELVKTGSASSEDCEAS